MFEILRLSSVATVSANDGTVFSGCISQRTDTTVTLETNADQYKLQGTVSDETHVEDVYIFVANQTAKIDNRKVFYRSNRGGKDPKTIDFAADLPLWPGSNMITVVARSSSEVKSVKTMFVYRDPPRTAQTQTTPPR